MVSCSSHVKHIRHGDCLLFFLGMVHFSSLTSYQRPAESGTTKFHTQQGCHVYIFSCFLDHHVECPSSDVVSLQAVSTWVVMDTVFFHMLRNWYQTVHWKRFYITFLIVTSNIDYYFRHICWVCYKTMSWEVKKRKLLGGRILYF